VNISAPFIARPVATTLLTLGVALAGAIAFLLLPVSPLPQVDYPTISVRASMPGASPETMAATVATPLERALGRIAGVTEITSSSSLGSTRVTLQFDLDRDIDGAARDVQAAINASRVMLPSGMSGNPSYRKVNPADAPIMIVALSSDTLSQGQMYDIASTVLAQKFAQIEGVGEVTVGGSSLPAVRVELNPRTLAKYAIDFETVRQAIVATNANRPKGSLESGSGESGERARYWQIQANDQAKTAAEYVPIIVAWRNNAPVTIGDLGEVVDSVQDLRNAGSTNGRPSVAVVLNRQPNANIIETVDRVRELLPQLRASIPSSIDMTVAMDRSPTIRASLKDVERTLAISTALVILVVFLFLRNWRAALIPSIAVPVSLIGTVGAMYLCGFSLNNLSLMALIVATGFVVDDAIVVLENVTRHIEAGMTPYEAALTGAREVSFTVLSMSVSLVAVFIPILLMGGIVGRLFNEFALTLSLAILISLAVSLTTTPMMCARLLRRGMDAERRPGRLRRWLEASGAAVQRGYARSLDWALGHALLMVVVLAVTVGLNFWLYVQVPKGFFPQQDTGRLTGFVRGDQGISFQAMRTKLATFIEIVRSDPAVESVTGFTGGGQRNSGSMFVTLKPLGERPPVGQVIARLRTRFAAEPGANLFLNPVQDIRVGGRQANAEYQFTLRADELQELRTWEPRVRRVLAQLPELTDVNTDQQERGLQTSLVIDRDTAARLGVTSRMVDTVLNNAFGQRQVSTIYNPLNQYKVVMEAAPEFWQSPEGLNDIFVTTSAGVSIPLAAFARYEMTQTALSVSHQGQFAASTISFNLAPGVSLSQATEAVNYEMARIGVPISVHGSFEGTARAFQQSLASQPWLILAALLTVYIVLGILYESLVHPLTILSTLPSAGVGALLALLAFGSEFSIIAFIGVILLIGIVKKNAIMMVDFALDAERREGLAPREAIRRACLLRFRPIMMTTMAALLGAIPLALGTGEGAELRRPLGIAIVGGLIVSQLLTLYTTPVVYLYLDRFRLWCRSRWARRERGAATPVQTP
jgi:multidrug efflux pump